MWATIKKISLYVGMLAGFVLTLQAFHGTFKTVWFGKAVRISKSSQNFLSAIVPLQQKLLMNLIDQKFISAENQKYMGSLLQLCSRWAREDNMQGKDIETFADMLALARQSGTLRANATVNYQKMVVESKVVAAIISLLLEQLQHVYIGTALSDLQLMSQYLQQLQNSGQYDMQQQVSLIRMYGIVLDIMHHFDGLAVTEYDFMVLSQYALFLQLVRYSVMN